MSLWSNIGAFFSRAAQPAKDAINEDVGIVKAAEFPQPDPMVESFDTLVDKQTGNGEHSGA